MRAKDWLTDNWKGIAKWGGLGVGCVAIALGAFVGARYISSGSTYEGELIDLAPSEVSTVVVVDNVPIRKQEFERFLDEMINQPRINQLERSSLWKDSLGEDVGSLSAFKAEKYQASMQEAEKSSDEAGIELFRDVLAGELIICTDAATTEDGKSETLMLSRVTRNVRFKWQFMDIGSWFFPDNPSQPKLEYSDGVLTITPPATPDKPTPETTMITVLDDVLVISNSGRLFNATVANHAGGNDTVNAMPEYQRTLNLAEPEQRERHVAGIWLNLDRMRDRLPPKETDEGEQVSPVDSFRSLPNSVVAIYPDIFGPVNRIVEMNVDTRPFTAAYYGIDISDPAVLKFDQYLLADDDRLAQDQYSHLRKTWAADSKEETQLKFLPPETMLQVSYRQPMDVLFKEVFDDDARRSLVGDFVVALNGPKVQAQLSQPAEELAFAALPRNFAPSASIPLSGIDLPLPGFVIGFRTPGAKPMAPKALLEEYLQAQRGRASKPGEEAKTGAVTVIPVQVGGEIAYGFHDPREEDNFIRRLNRSIRCALIGEWLILTNSEQMILGAFEALETANEGLKDTPGSPWRIVPTEGHATIYLNFSQFADYATSRELFKVLRDNKYNTALIDGLDPGEVRRKIAAELGHDPADPSNLTKQDVNAEYNRRKAAWLQTCQIEGDRYIAELQNDMNALRFFRDLALVTTFEPDHLHVQGILRVGG